MVNCIKSIFNLYQFFSKIINAPQTDHRKNDLGAHLDFYSYLGPDMLVLKISFLCLQMLLYWPFYLLELSQGKWDWKKCSES